MSALDEHHAIVFDDDGANTDKRMFGEFAVHESDAIASCQVELRDYSVWR